jgi:hypothetical protein
MSFGQSIDLFKIAGKTWAWLMPGNGTLPVYILNRIQPNAHRSEEHVDSQSLIISGAIKFTVPTNVPWRWPECPWLYMSENISAAVPLNPAS